MVFSKFDFTNGECAIGGGSTKKPVLDPKAALGKIQKHKEKIQSLQAIGKPSYTLPRTYTDFTGNLEIKVRARTKRGLNFH